MPYMLCHAAQPGSVKKGHQNQYRTRKGGKEVLRILERVPLEEQIGRLEKGYPAHPEFTASAIRTWAGTPMSVYMGSFREEQEELAEILGVAEEEISRMPYQEAATRAARIRQGGGRQADADRSIFLLAQPFIRCFKARRQVYERNGEETA